MDDWNAATEGSAPFRCSTRLTIMEVDGATTPIGSLLLSGIKVVESIPGGVGDTVILYIHPLQWARK
jgi:hypothetical protein